MIFLVLIDDGVISGDGLMIISMMIMLVLMIVATIIMMIIIVSMMVMIMIVSVNDNSHNCFYILKMNINIF